MDNFSPELFSSLVERIDLGVIVLDSDLCILRWNGFISQRSGKNQSLASGRPFLEVFPDTDPQSFAKVVALARDRGIHVYNHWLEQAPWFSCALRQLAK